MSPTFNHAPFAALILPNDSNSRPEDLSTPIVSESHDRKGPATLNEAGENPQDSGRELNLGHLQKRSTGSLPLEESNRSCAYINKAAALSNDESSTSSMKGDVKYNSTCFNTNGAFVQSDVVSSSPNAEEHKRFQDCVCCEFEGDKAAVFLTASCNEDWNVLVENASQVSGAACSLEDAGDERLGEGPTAL